MYSSHISYKLAKCELNRMLIKKHLVRSHLNPGTFCNNIKTHDSESRGQEEAGRTRRTSELFTRSTALKFVNALNKLP